MQFRSPPPLPKEPEMKDAPDTSTFRRGKKVMKASRIRASSETLVFRETLGNKEGQRAILLKIAAAALFDCPLWPSLPVPLV
jgi:hypothetical protein